MSKLDVRAALKTEALNCEYQGNPGKVILVTEEVLAKNPGDESSNAPDISVGEAMVVFKNPVSGKTEGRVLIPGKHLDLKIIVRDEAGNTHKIDQGDTQSMHRSMRALNEIEGAVGGVVEKISKYVDSVFTRIIARSRFATPETISSALSFELDRFRMNERKNSGITDEQLDKITTARALRETIGRIDPEHEDALVSGGRYVSEGHAREVVAEMGVRTTELPSQMMRALKADRRLSQEVFGAITETPIDQLSAQIISREDADGFRQKMRPGLISGGYAATIKSRLQDIFSEQMPGYKDMYEVELYKKGDADLMLVQDHVASYVYGWDTDSRKLVVADEVALTEADVPSDEEIARLRTVLEDLRFDVNGEDIVFDLFGDVETDADLDDEVDFGFDNDDEFMDDDLDNDDADRDDFWNNVRY